MRFFLGTVAALFAACATVDATGCKDCLGYDPSDLASMCERQVASSSVGLGPGAQELNVAKTNCDKFFKTYDCCYGSTCSADPSVCLHPTKLIDRSIYPDGYTGVAENDLNEISERSSGELRPRSQSVCCSVAKTLYAGGASKLFIGGEDERKAAVIVLGAAWAVAESCNHWYGLGCNVWSFGLTG